MHAYIRYLGDIRAMKYRDGVGAIVEVAEFWPIRVFLGSRK